jgi:hypothetical protein
VSRFIFRAALPLAVVCCAPAAFAQERCLAAEYKPPASIDEEMRPYLVCGMLQGNGHNLERINGVQVAINSSGLSSCSTLRSRALTAADRRLARIIPDAAARRAVLQAEFEKADRFLVIAARSDDLLVGEQTSAPACRNQNAQD